MNNFPRIASGCDALYYFAQTNGAYDAFFETLVTQINDRKLYFESINYAYHDNDIILKLLDYDLIYSGMGRDGFYWCNHSYFRIGFKDSEKNPSMHNIRVQLNAIGIYELGISSLLKLINNYLIKDITTGYFPVTRIDLNAFIAYDFSNLKKEMIVSKKKAHATTLGERMSGYELETYYVGKKPFLLRIYNKKKELQSAKDKKQEVMAKYFADNKFDMSEPLFNVEFEMGREFLKSYKIDTIDDALERAESLFQMSCDLIRIIDTDSISDKELNSTNRSRAKTLDVWSFLKLSYSISGFIQIQTPLERVKKEVGYYSLEDARKSIKKIIMRLLIHGNSPTSLYFSELLEYTKEEYELKQNHRVLHEEYKEEEAHHKRSVYDKFLDELKTMSDEGLRNYEVTLSKEMDGLSIELPIYHELQMKYDALTDVIAQRIPEYIPF